MKIVFVGHPGSGKTYAATKLSQITGIQETDIDDLLHNPIYFLSTTYYRNALLKLLEKNKDWIIDGYGGKRMPNLVWQDADSIIYINLPKSELRHNVFARYRAKRHIKEKSHGQSTFVNTIKNLLQIYLLDWSLHSNIKQIRQTLSLPDKFIEINSRHELQDLIARLGSELRLR